MLLERVLRFAITVRINHEARAAVEELRLSLQTRDWPSTYIASLASFGRKLHHRMCCLGHIRKRKTTALPPTTTRPRALLTGRLLRSVMRKPGVCCIHMCRDPVRSAYLCVSHASLENSLECFVPRRPFSGQATWTYCSKAHSPRNSHHEITGTPL
jgi:hypothetical protein